MNLKKFLCTLSGDDYSIIIECDKRIQTRFAVIGGFVLFIFILCIVSSYFTFTMIFHNYIIGVPISIFFSWMITNIYLLLLYTLTKNVLPHKINIKSRILSLLMRIGFICFIAIIISKPVEVLIFSHQLPIEIAKYKEDQIHKYKSITTKYFEDETQQLIKIIESQEKLYGNTDLGQIQNYKELLTNKESQKDILISDMVQLVNESNYYIQGIIILNNQYRVCWIITFIFIIIFLIPALLKNFILTNNDYYSIKKNIETTLILQEYASFKSHYYTSFLQKFNVHINYREQYLDPPFNIIRIMDQREFHTEDDLISELYND